MAAVFDLRSDTVTQPTPGMREAMARAPVGDDCYGDDPTVLELEARVAALLGKEAAVYLPTGTMANQLAVATHARAGETIATHQTAHVRIHEDASAAALSGVQVMPLGSRLGYDVQDLEALCAEEACGWPRVAAAWMENTVGDPGGVPWPLPGMQAVADWARAHGRATHVDGARLWNAHVATGVALSELAAVGDTVSVALSKGLGAPGGSLLAGTQALIARARARKHGFGGGMRQAGILAAAGLYALEHHLPRMHEDHRRATQLAAGIGDLAGWEVTTPSTSMVIARVCNPVTHAEQLCGPLRDAGVLCYPNRHLEVRLVLHLGIDDDALRQITRRIREVVPATVAILSTA